MRRSFESPTSNDDIEGASGYIRTVTQKPRGRYYRLACYVFLAVAGVIQLISPTKSMMDTCGPVVSHVWGVLLLFGGVTCFIGEARKHWVGEYVGLPALSLTWFAYGVAVLFTVRGEPPRVGVGLMLIGIGFMYGGRWFDSAAQRKLAILENGADA